MVGECLLFIILVRVIVRGLDIVADGWILDFCFLISQTTCHTFPFFFTWVPFSIASNGVLTFMSGYCTAVSSASSRVPILVGLMLWLVYFIKSLAFLERFCRKLLIGCALTTMLSYHVRSSPWIFSLDIATENDCLGVI